VFIPTRFPIAGLPPRRLCPKCKKFCGFPDFQSRTFTRKAKPLSWKFRICVFPKSGRIVRHRSPTAWSSLQTARCCSRGGQSKIVREIQGEENSRLRGGFVIHRQDHHW